MQRGKKQKESKGGTGGAQTAGIRAEHAGKTKGGMERLSRGKKTAEGNGYPMAMEVIELLEKNEETLQFVDDYAQQKDLP